MLSLVLLVIMSLIAAAFSSSRTAAQRAVTASAAEQALFSAFARFDRPLYEDSGLLAVNAGFGTAQFRPGVLLEEAEADMRPVLHPAGILTGWNRDLLGFGETHADITGYSLLTDDGGKPFTRQICSLARERWGGDALRIAEQKLFSRQTQAEDWAALRERKQREAELETARRREEAKQAAAAAEGGTAENGSGAPDSEEGGNGADFENPLETISRLRSTAVFRLLLPDAGSVSGYRLRESTVSARPLRHGMLMVPSASRTGDEKLLLLLYASSELPCLTDAAPPEKGLQYQLEYLAGGKTRDRDNLRMVLERLLAVREAANLAYLLSDAEKSAEADRLAGIVSTLLAAPETEPVVAFQIKSGWAFAEAVLDVRALVRGGKVSLAKTDKTWQVSLAGIGTVLFGGQTKQAGEEGMSYRDYLRLLLFAKSAQDLTDGLMDMTEHRMRVLSERSAFRLDNCLDALELETHVTAGSRIYTIRRSFGYDQ